MSSRKYYGWLELLNWVRAAFGKGSNIIHLGARQLDPAPSNDIWQMQFGFFTYKHLLRARKLDPTPSNDI